MKPGETYYRGDVFPDPKDKDKYCVVCVKVKLLSVSRNGWHTWQTVVPNSMQDYQFKTAGRGHYSSKQRDFRVSIKKTPREAVANAVESRVLMLLLNGVNDGITSAFNEAKRIRNMFLGEFYPVCPEKDYVL